jgi:hypothetical protein
MSKRETRMERGSVGPFRLFELRSQLDCSSVLLPPISQGVGGPGAELGPRRAHMR